MADEKVQKVVAPQVEKKSGDLTKGSYNPEVNTKPPQPNPPPPPKKTK
jgi:hypothetical protein